MRSGNLLSGLIIVVIGVLLLGNSMGWWDWSVVSSLWRLWPLLLIVMGIQMLFGHNGRSQALILLVLVLLGLAIWYGRLGPWKMMPITKMHTSVGRSFNWSFGDSGTTESSSFTSEVSVNNLSKLAVQLGRHFDITISGADTDKVSVDLKGPKSVLDTVSLAPDGSSLVLKDGNNEGVVHWADNVPEVTGTITLPKQLALQLDLAGFTTATVKQHQGKIVVKSSGATNVTFQDSNSTDPELALSGTGKISLDKCQGQGDFDLSGLGLIAANSCNLTKLTANVSGSGSVEVKAGTIGDLSANLSGLAKLRVPKPSGQINQDVSGASKVELF